MACHMISVYYRGLFGPQMADCGDLLVSEIQLKNLSLLTTNIPFQPPSL